MPSDTHSGDNKELQARLQECIKNNQRVLALLQELVHLGEPPYAPAIFRGFSEMVDPRKDEIKRILGFEPKYRKCWLMLASGDEIVGTAEQKLSEKLMPDQMVLTNSNNAVVAIVPEAEISLLAGVKESQVINALDNGRVIVDFGRTNREAIISKQLKEEVKKKALVTGDKVLVFAWCVIRILERRELMTTKKDLRKVSFEDIGGLDNEIKEIRELLALDFSEEACRAMNKDVPRGFILWGPPGNGKGMIMLALANHLGYHCEIINGSEITSRYVGDTPERLRESFNEALKNKPAFWVIDEAEALMPVRGGSITREYTIDYISQINTLLDGLEDTKGVYAVFLTNRKDIIDPAVIRPGRFDRQIFIPRPSAARAPKILNIYFRRHPVGEKDGDEQEVIGRWTKKIVDELYYVGKRTHLFDAYYGDEVKKFYFRDFTSGAFLKHIVDELVLRALKRMKNEGIEPGDKHFGIRDVDLEGIVDEAVFKSVPMDKMSLLEWLKVNGYRRPDDVRFDEALEKKRED
jgi:SpoVK/Ycf46/Vps4 family AAA+-type ATPase